MKVHFKIIATIFGTLIYIITFGQANLQVGPGTITSGNYQASYSVYTSTPIYNNSGSNTQLNPTAGPIHLFINNSIPGNVNYVNQLPTNFTSSVNTNLPVGKTQSSYGVSQSGAATYNVPIVVPPGTMGMVPKLSVSYNSQGTEGIAGYGWNLSGLSCISRLGQTPYHNFNSTYPDMFQAVTLTNSDWFALDGNRLIVTNNGNYGADGTTYGTESETFNLVTSYSSYGNGPDHFIVQTKDGLIMEYGNTADSKLVPTSVGTVFMWFIDRITDQFGNYITFQYINNNTGEVHIKEIDYTGNPGFSPYNSVVFSYGLKTESNTVYVAGGGLNSTVVLNNITVNCHGAFLKKYSFEYAYNTYTMLQEIDEMAADHSTLNPLLFSYGSDNYPPDVLDCVGAYGYQPKNLSNTCVEDDLWLNSSLGWTFYGAGETAQFILGDYYGNGHQDVISIFDGNTTQETRNDYTGCHVFSQNPYTFTFTPTSGSATQYELPFCNTAAGNMPQSTLDFNGDGKDDYSVSTFTVSGNEGSNMEEDINIALSTGSSFGAYNTLQTYNMNTYANPIPYVDINQGGEWGPQSSTTVQNLNLSGTFYLDMNGDGQMDVFNYHFDPLGVETGGIPTEYYRVWLNAGSTSPTPQGVPTTNPNFEITVPEPPVVDNYLDGGGNNWIDYSYDYLDFSHAYQMDLYGDGRVELVNVYQYYGQLYTSQLGLIVFTPPQRVIVSFDANQVYGTSNPNYVATVSGTVVGNTGVPGTPGNGIVITPDNSSLPYNSQTYVTNSSGTASLSYGTSPYLLFGDFNGDGISDALYYNGSWILYLGKGDGTYSTINISTLPGDSPFSYPTYFYYANDINGDGKTDILEFIPTYDPNNPHDNSTVINTYYCTGTSFVQGQTNTLQGNYIDPSTWQITFGDFNGDGVNDLFLESTSGDGDDVGDPQLLFFYTGTNSRHLAEVVNGYNQKVEFSYQPLANAANYTQSQGNGFYGSSSFPANLLDFTPSMYVVTSLTEPGGSGSNTNIGTKTYSYKDAIYNPQGLGFLGFLELSSSNNLTGFTTTANNTILSPFNNLVPSTSITSVPYTSTISDDDYTFTPNSLGGLRYFLPLTQQIHNDDIIGSTTTSNYTYDNYGNITDNNTQVSVTSTTNLVATTDIQKTYTISDTWIPSSVATTITTAWSAGNLTYPRQMQYNWDNAGHLTSTIMDPNYPTEYVENDYTYDPNTGVLLTQAMSSPDPSCPSTLTSYTYDATSQFVNYSKNSLNQITNSLYDYRWGEPTQVTTPDGLTSYHLYDARGRTIQNVTPDGLQQNITYNWTSSSDFPLGTSPPFDIGPAGLNTALYKINSQKSGSPSVTAYYDWFDRAIGSAADGFNTTVYSVKSYNYLGLSNQTSEPYQNGGTTPVIQTNQYNDVFNRLTETDITANSQPTLTTAYSYTPNTSLGTMTTTTNKPDGTVSSQTTDPTGLLINSTDYVAYTNNAYSSIDYTYFSNRQIASILLNGNQVNSFVYDAFGRKTTMLDINLGVTTGNGYIYSYNAYNQLTSQTDPNGNTSSMTYDVLGRLRTKVSSLEGTYTYNYVTSGNGLNNLSNVTLSSNGSRISYSYDNLNRPLQINVNGLTTAYKYDAFGNVITKTYPGGFAINNTYSSTGYLTQTNRADNGALIWQGNTMNAFGQYTQYTLGNGVQTQKTYTPYDYLESIEAGSYENMLSTFDPTSGNLTNRIENTLSESFNYDYPLNSRLTEAITYASFTEMADITVNYDQNGNIISKGDICAPSTAYVNGNSNNQVTSVPNSNNIITPPQTVTYTSFNAPTNISNTNYSLAFTYGPDNNREQTILTDPTDNATTRYFANDYEKTLYNSTLQSEVNYISCGGDLVGMCVNNDMYYVYSDHLGSILTVSDGTNTYNQSFDAFGNYRDPSTGTFTGTPPSGNPTWLYRGYTGHEHLPQFQLINANGRLYDPLVNSMLSPDPFVQDPSNTQNYNKYSYCLNNPLKYSDPSGFLSQYRGGGGGGSGDDYEASINAAFSNITVDIDGQEVTYSGDAPWNMIAGGGSGGGCPGDVVFQTEAFLKEYQARGEQAAMMTATMMGGINEEIQDANDDNVTAEFGFYYNNNQNVRLHRATIFYSTYGFDEESESIAQAQIWKEVQQSLNNYGNAGTFNNTSATLDGNGNIQIYQQNGVKFAGIGVDMSTWAPGGAVRTMMGKDAQAIYNWTADEARSIEMIKGATEYLGVLGVGLAASGDLYNLYENPGLGNEAMVGYDIAIGLSMLLPPPLDIIVPIGLTLFEGTGAMDPYIDHLNNFQPITPFGH